MTTRNRKEYMKEYDQRPEVKARHQASEHKTYHKIYDKAYNQTPEHKAYMRDYLKTYRQNAKRTVFEHYGNRCACCGETETLFLQIDHINNDGAKHRKEIGGAGGGYMYYWIIKNNFPTNLQLLCCNCNFAKGMFGVCPHEAQKLSDKTIFSP